MASTNNNYKTYSSKGISTLGTGLGYGVNEMTETALSMGLNSQRRNVIEGVTKNIDDPFLNDVIQDGVSAGLGYLTGQAMRLQEDVLSSSYKIGASAVIGWYSKSKIKGFLKGKKGRKLGMISKFLGDNDNKGEECRIISDFVKISGLSSLGSRPGFLSSSIISLSVGSPTSNFWLASLISIVSKL